MTYPWKDAIEHIEATKPVSKRGFYVFLIRNSRYIYLRKARFVQWFLKLLLIFKKLNEKSQECKIFLNLLLRRIKYCTHECTKSLFLLYDLVRRQKRKIREIVDSEIKVIKNFRFKWREYVWQFFTYILVEIFIQQLIFLFSVLKKVIVVYIYSLLSGLNVKTWSTYKQAAICVKILLDN